MYGFTYGSTFCYLFSRWRIVIHGGIDGFSQMIMFLQPSENNRSSSVMEQFVQVVDRFGVLSRVRCDHGGENNAVCLFMDIFRRPAQGSTLRGRSTHNQRTERLWRDVWNGLSNEYHSLFTLLEHDGILDCNNEMHLWALHYVYLPRINRDLRLFANQWNRHGLRTSRYVPVSSVCAGRLPFWSDYFECAANMGHT